MLKTVLLALQYNKYVISLHQGVLLQQWCQTMDLWERSSLTTRKRLLLPALGVNAA